jgi:hypothetical protein
VPHSAGTTAATVGAPGTAGPAPTRQSSLLHLLLRRPAIRQTRAVLRAALGQAERDELAGRNVAKLVRSSAGGARRRSMPCAPKVSHSVLLACPPSSRA